MCTHNTLQGHSVVLPQYFPFCVSTLSSHHWVRMDIFWACSNSVQPHTFTSMIYSACFDEMCYFNKDLFIRTLLCGDCYMPCVFDMYCMSDCCLLFGHGLLLPSPEIGQIPTLAIECVLKVCSVIYAIRTATCDCTDWVMATCSRLCTERLLVYANEPDCFDADLMLQRYLCVCVHSFFRWPVHAYSAFWWLHWQR